MSLLRPTRARIDRRSLSGGQSLEYYTSRNAVALDTIGWTGYIAMSIFVLLLIVGFFVEWRRGALEWE